MGTKGMEIVKLDKEELIRKLNALLANEWLAYYQYWVGSKIIVGLMKGEVKSELEEHAGQELEHANMLAERIDQLGGMPVLNPDDWRKVTDCEYGTPNDPTVRGLLKQNILTEQCAIEAYNDLVDMTRGKDPITYHTAMRILSVEIEHEHELEMLLRDLDTQ